MRKWAYRFAGIAAWRHWLSMLAASALLCICASAQTIPTSAVPAMQIGTAALIKPVFADNYYSSRTVTATPIATLEGKASLPPPPEIVELARAPKNSPDLIYEYVHNNINVNWMYGLQKGVLGTLIDKSGTPFDQAALTLLNQAGYSASYRTGTITLTGAQFTAWTGIADANAACQLLANGGFPGLINNGNVSTLCAIGPGGAVTSVQMGHIWVVVSLSGCTNNLCEFDPSYKIYNKQTGIDLGAATGMNPGDPLQTATANIGRGSITGVPTVNYVSGLHSVDLNAALTGYSQNLLNKIYSLKLQCAHLEDVIGGGAIVP